MAVTNVTATLCFGIKKVVWQPRNHAAPHLCKYNVMVCRTMLIHHSLTPCVLIIADSYLAVKNDTIFARLGVLFSNDFSFIAKKVV